MNTKVIILFPYSGFIKNDPREKLFWALIDCCREETNKQSPIVVLNKDTESRGGAKAFLENKRTKNEITLYKCWAVDTCQMWLAGWGFVMDNQPIRNNDRIVQLPGDIDLVGGMEGNHDSFFNELGAFISGGNNWDIVFGDFSSGDIFHAKELIDLYSARQALPGYAFPPDTPWQKELESLKA